MKYITSDKVFYHLNNLGATLNNEDNVSPVTIEIHPSNVCNNKCYYCSMHKVKDAKMMTKSELLYSIEFVERIGVKGIIFSGGGEPTIHPDFADALYFCKSIQKLDIGIITNGVALNDKNRKAILETASWCRISLDSLFVDTYKDIRGTDTLSIVQDNIKKMLVEKKELGSDCIIGLQMVVNKYNYKQIKQFYGDCLEKFSEIDYIQIRPIEIKLTEIPYTDEELAEIYTTHIKKDSLPNKVNWNDKWDLIFGKREFGFTACHCAPLIGVIDAYGDYYLCCHVVKQEDYKVCNIDDMDVNAFFKAREEMFKRLGALKGFHPKVCPVGCRGSAINRSMEGLKKGHPHENFL